MSETSGLTGLYMLAFLQVVVCGSTTKKGEHSLGHMTVNYTTVFASWGICAVLTSF